MRTAENAASEFERWVKYQRVVTEPVVRHPFSLTTQLLRFLEDEGFDFVAGRYETFLQMTLIVLGRILREPEYLLEVGVFESDERHRLVVPPQDIWLDHLGEDVFREVAYRYGRKDSQPPGT